MEEIEKIKLELPEIQWVKKFYNGNAFLVNPIISLENQQTLIEKYLELVNSNEPTTNSHYFNAELGFILGVINLCTNISIKDLTDEEINNLIGGGLWTIIRQEISNFSEVKEKIDFIYKMYRENTALDKSVGSVLQNLSTEIVLFMDKISKDMNIDTDKLNKVAEKFGKEVNNLNKTLGVKSEEIVTDKTPILSPKIEKKVRKSKKNM